MLSDFLNPDELVDRSVLSALTDPKVAGPPIDDDTVEAAARFIERSGALEMVERWQAEDRAGLHPGGRPASMGTLGVLTCFKLLAITNTPLLVTRFEELVTLRLSPTARARLGITEPSPGDDWYSRSFRAVHSLLKLVDAFPGPPHPPDRRRTEEGPRLP